MPPEPRTRVLVVSRDLEIRRRVAHALGSDGEAFDLEEVPDAATAGPGSSQAALSAGAVDSVGEDRIDQEVLRRTIRFATERTRLQREAHARSVVDAPTGLYNARRFEQLVEHHLRLAERSGEAVVLVFIRLDVGERGDPSADLIRDTADVLARPCGERTSSAASLAELIRAADAAMCASGPTAV